jgi:hypothetical protein
MLSVDYTERTNSIGVYGHSVVRSVRIERFVCRKKHRRGQKRILAVLSRYYVVGQSPCSRCVEQALITFAAVLWVKRVNVVEARAY